MLNSCSDSQSMNLKVKYIVSGWCSRSSTHKGRGVCLCIKHTTKVGGFNCVSSTHKGMGFYLCIKHIQGYGVSFVHKAHTKVGG